MDTESKTQDNIKKQYTPPQIILELELETRAGSGPIGNLPDGLDIFGDQ